MQLIDLALHVATKYPVHALDASKAPVTEHGFKDATREPAAVRAQFSHPRAALIGVATGKPSGLLILDIDPKGQAWLEANRHRLPVTRTHHTRRGLHLVFAMPADGVHVPSTRNKIALGVDIRADGGYAAWWPAAGLSVENADTIAPAPEWLVEAARGGRAPAPIDADNPLATVTPRANLTLEQTDKLFGFLDFDDYDEWVLAGMASHHEHGDAGFDVWNAHSATSPKYPGAAEARKKWESFGRYSGKPVSMRNVIKLAKERGATKELWTSSPQSEQTAVIADAPKIARRAPIDWHALEGRDPPARAWIIPHWLPDGHMILLAGRAGIGKTLVAQHVATAVALGRPYLEPIDPRCVLFWAGEDDADELWRRQRPIADYFGAKLSELAGRLTLVSYSGVDMTLLTPVYGQLQATPMLDELRAQVHDYRAQLVILDNIARLYGGGENDRHSVTKFCALVQGACAPAAVLLLGHPAKAAGSEFSGSTAWEAAVRARLYLDDKPPDADEDDRPIDPHVRYLARRKSNYSALELRRFELRSGVLLPDFVAVSKPSEASARDAVLAAVAKLAELGQHGTASTASPNYLPKLAAQYGLLGPHGKREFAAAMRRALVDGALVNAEVGKYSNHSPKFGITVHK